MTSRKKTPARPVDCDSPRRVYTRLTGPLAEYNREIDAEPGLGGVSWGESYGPEGSCEDCEETFVGYPKYCCNCGRVFGGSVTECFPEE